MFVQEYVDLNQRQVKDLEKSNTTVRRENSELKVVLKASEKTMKKVENEVESTRAILKMEHEMSETENEA